MLSRSRLAVLVAALVVIVGLVSIPVVHHLRGARFDTAVTPIRTLQDCITATQREFRQVNGLVNAGELCQSGSPGTWFQTTVRNVGHRGAWLNTCDISTLDRNGDITLTGTVRTRALNFPAGPYLDPGQAIFFVSPMFDERGGSLLMPPDGTTSYRVSCPPIDYHGNVPA
jgi:hypothetical protein